MKKTIVASCLAVALAWVITACAEEPTAQWNALVDEYLDKVYFPLNPTTATLDGVHNYDSEIEDYSRAGVEAQDKKLHDLWGVWSNSLRRACGPSMQQTAKSCWARSAATC
jgi:hypothetical protein